MLNGIKKYFKEMNTVSKRIVLAVGVFFIVIILFCILYGIFKNRKLSYLQIENKLKTAAISYYEENVELLPKEEGSKVSVSSTALIEGKYMKELTKYNKDTELCSANVTVTNNNGKYLYSPNLVCSEYKTTTISSYIINNSEIVTSGTGLYQIVSDYVYRGEYPFNYVSFSGKIWRIIKITSDGELELIQLDAYEDNPWDNRYNTDSTYNSGITADYEISRVADTLNKLFNDDGNFTDASRSYVVAKNLCVAARDKKETNNTGSVECSKLTEKKYPLGLLQVNEYMYGSLDAKCIYPSNSTCSNYNYFTKFENDFWTITPFKENTYEVYYLSKTVQYEPALNYKAIRPVLYIDSSSRYVKGNGSLDNPYVFE